MTCKLFERFLPVNYINNYNGREFVYPENCQLPYYDETNKEVKFGKVDFIERHKIKKRRFKLTTKLGHEIIVTEDHSIMVLTSDGEVVQKTPLEINTDDEIITI
jgi:intein/homing endonuclease